MRVVFIGCKPFNGTDKCGFQFSFYENHFKIGDKYEVSEHYDDMSDVFNNESLVIHLRWDDTFQGTFPIEYFISLEEWRGKRLNELGI